MYRSILAMIVCTVIVVFSGTPLHARIEVDSVQKMTTESAPRDISISADGKRVFILTADGKIDVLGSGGKVIGRLTVPATVEGIESSPDGGVLFLRDGADKSVQIMTISLVNELNIASSPIRGNKDAPVTLAVFSDFQ